MAAQGMNHLFFRQVSHDIGLPMVACVFACLPVRQFSTMGAINQWATPNSARHAPPLHLLHQHATGRETWAKGQTQYELSLGNGIIVGDGMPD